MSHRFRLISATLFAATATPALAQADVAPAPADAEGDLIIVTAQKIEQRAIDVPITISATSGARDALLQRHRHLALARVLPSDL